MIGQAGEKLIKAFEGLHLKAYLCPAKVWTIGWGSTKGVTPSMVITEAEAQERFIADCIKAERNLVGVTLNQNQRDALISFVFNLGSGAFERSTLKMKLKRGDYNAASKEFPKWCYAKGVKLKGLTLRREAERQLFCS